ENSEMQRIVMPLAATLIGAAFVAASPLPASASAEDHVKARHAKRIQVRCQKKVQRVVKKTQRVVLQLVRSLPRHGPPGGWLPERRQSGARIRVLRPADPRAGWRDCRDAEPRRRRGLRRGRLQNTRRGYHPR